MNEAADLSLTYILSIINAIPDSPLMWLFGLSLVLAIVSLLFNGFKGKI
jgi:hypothetical protein